MNFCRTFKILCNQKKNIESYNKQLNRKPCFSYQLSFWDKANLPIPPIPKTAHEYFFFPWMVYILWEIKKEIPIKRAIPIDCILLILYCVCFNLIKSKKISLDVKDFGWDVKKKKVCMGIAIVLPLLALVTYIAIVRSVFVFEYT